MESKDLGGITMDSRRQRISEGHGHGEKRLRSRLLSLVRGKSSARGNEGRSKEE